MIDHINAKHVGNNKKRHSCSLCPFESERRKVLLTHLSQIHQVEKTTQGKRLYQCQVCKVKVKKAALKKHVSECQSSVFQCQHCQFVSQKRADFQGHMLVVHDKKDMIQYEENQLITGGGADDLIVFSAEGNRCSLCDYSSASLRYLRDHVRKVHLSKLIKCPHCDQKSKRKADLIKHIKRIHPDTIHEFVANPIRPHQQVRFFINMY